MKNFGKALKLYLKVSFNPIVSAFGIFIMVGVVAAAVFSPESPENEDYMSMIAAAGFAQIGVGIFFIAGGPSMARNKYYISLPFAKMLFTVIPAVTAAVMSLIYDNVIFAVAAFCWQEQALADIMIIAPVNSFMVCLAVSCMGKPKLEPLYIIPMIILATEHLVLPNISAAAHGFGLPVVTSAVIGFLIFIAGAAVTLLIMNIWWRNSDRVYRRTDIPVQPQIS